MEDGREGLEAEPPLPDSVLLTLMDRSERRAEMDRLATETVHRYERMDFEELLKLARSGDYAEVRTIGDYAVSVTCLLDDPKSEEVVRILASVNRRDSRLSCMFPRTKDGLVLSEPESRP